MLRQSHLASDDRVTGVLSAGADYSPSESRIIAGGPNPARPYCRCVAWGKSQRDFGVATGNRPRSFVSLGEESSHASR